MESITWTDMSQKVYAVFTSYPFSDTASRSVCKFDTMLCYKCRCNNHFGAFPSKQMTRYLEQYSAGE